MAVAVAVGVVVAVGVGVVVVVAVGVVVVVAVGVAVAVAVTPVPKPAVRVKQRKPLKRSGRIKAKGRSRFPKRRDPQYLAWIRELPCLAQGEGPCSGRTEAAHVKSRGAGGDDRGNVVPLCSRHHHEQHLIGLASFERKHRRNMQSLANDLENAYTTRGFV